MGAHSPPIGECYTRSPEVVDRSSRPEDSTLIEALTGRQSSIVDEASSSVPVFVLVWSRHEPQRVGELARLDGAAPGVRYTLGRAVGSTSDGARPLTLCQLRPTSREDTGPFRAAHVSRRQLLIDVERDGSITVTQAGRGTLLVNGRTTERATLRLGDVVAADHRFMLLLTLRPADWPRAGEPATFPFGVADPHGLVGESPIAWALREQIAMIARRDEHALIHGPSGAGKELVVQAIHARSSRARETLISRNAATIPETLVDAELFGNLRNYPNTGTPARPGLLGEADRSTLFLDEIGELPHAMQAHLLRVMDCGEYQRLGDARVLTTTARIIGATNRDLAELKHDFLARFIHRVAVPGLDARPEDVILVARHLLRAIAETDDEIRERFFEGDEPSLSPRLVYQLLRVRFTTHVRQLAELLWRSVAASKGRTIDQLSTLDLYTPPTAKAPELVDETTGLSRARVLQVLEEVGGVRERAWRELGLRNRYQLRRLLQNLKIE
ncbi:MAG: sigma 54-interacting transcriptional regulator [Nannocystaceae bacterium]